ncbi:hypothetical protein F2Q68_00032730 [Brassica cretica]|uniref:Uncharacterized protein n=1 Tax=Brassica cretica TaxID=69181 RepID=A0A8S9GGY5_BRACR|nr:hypothetical protein F2Q68_00032730 [Brassica cretica]
MQKRDDTYHIQAEAAWERTRSIDTSHQKTIDKLPQQSIDTNNNTSFDNHPIPKTTVSEKDKLDNQYLTPYEFGIFIDGRTLHVSREDIADILQTANGADNLFMHQRSNREQKTTKEFYDTAGGRQPTIRVFCEHIGLDLYCLLSRLDPNESLGIKIDQHREQYHDSGLFYLSDPSSRFALN